MRIAPWFAFGFVGMVLFNSPHGLSASVVAVTSRVDTALLAMSMAALSLATYFGIIRKAVNKPPCCCPAGWWRGGALINRWVPALLA